MDIGQEIGLRLRQFGEREYGTMTEFARRLEITPQQLNAYLTGKRIPGNRMKRKLEALKCNMTWLLIGKYPNEFLAEIKSREKEEEKILNNLRLLGLDTWEKVNDILAPTLRIVEKMEEYKTKGKKK